MSTFRDKMTNASGLTAEESKVLKEREPKGDEEGVIKALKEVSGG
jgi:hypothetical protein